MGGMTTNWARSTGRDTPTPTLANKCLNVGADQLLSRKPATQCFANRRCRLFRRRMLPDVAWQICKEKGTQGGREGGREGGRQGGRKRASERKGDRGSQRQGESERENQRKRESIHTCTNALSIAFTLSCVCASLSLALSLALPLSRSLARALSLSLSLSLSVSVCLCLILSVARARVIQRLISGWLLLPEVVLLRKDRHALGTWVNIPPTHPLFLTQTCTQNSAKSHNKHMQIPGRDVRARVQSCRVEMRSASAV